MLRRAAAILAVLALLAVGGGQATAGGRADPPQGPVLVYETNRPSLQVSITRRGDRIYRAGVSAPGVCSNGEETSTGFGLVGGAGWPIGPRGLFVRSSGDRLFRVRFEGDRAVGIFRQSRVEVGGSTEGVPPRCGNTRPWGRYQHFVARLVEP
jgi:hypothetical protein